MPQPDNIFQRGNTWYAKVTRNGKTERVSLKTRDRKLALQKAAALVREIEAGNPQFLDLIRGRVDCATIGDYLAAFALYWKDRKRNARTARDYRQSLLRILKAAYPKATEDGLLKLKLRVLDAELMEKYQAARLATVDASTDQDALNRVKLGIHSQANQARALFSEKARKATGVAKLTIPDLTGFMQFTFEEAEDKGYRAPSIDTINATITQAKTLQETDRPRWFAFILAVAVGLRRSEAIAAKWDWIAWVPQYKPQLDGTIATVADIQLRVDITKDFKTKRGQRTVSMDPAIFKAMSESRTDLHEHIIPLPSKTAREICFRENARWLRGLGWDPNRPNHHLRKFFADILRQLYGLDAAQGAMGHKSSKTTEQVYTGTGAIGKTTNPLIFIQPNP